MNSLEALRLAFNLATPPRIAGPVDGSLREVKADNSRYACCAMNQRDQPADSARCSACGVEFACGAADPAGCWCIRLPALPSGGVVSGAGCLCEQCLRQRIATAAGSPAIAEPAVR
jgi:hypothetical protein